MAVSRAPAVFVSQHGVRDPRVDEDRLRVVAVQSEQLQQAVGSTQLLDELLQAGAEAGPQLLVVTGGRVSLFRSPPVQRTKYTLQNIVTFVFNLLTAGAA